VPERRSIRAALWISTIGPTACLLALIARWIYLRQNPTFWLTWTNFVVVLFPFALSIFFAFVPDMRKKHIAWRIGVIVFGVAFSIAVWQQQRLSAIAAKQDQENTVGKAVAGANEHSDAQIGEVKQEVQGVRSDVQEVKKAISSSETNLNKSIGEVKIPKEEKATMESTFYPVNLKEWPIREKSIPSVDGVVSLSFTFRAEGYTAKNARVWLRLCTDCKYAKEPAGFQNLTPNVENGTHERYRVIGDFLPNVAYQPMNVDVIPPPGLSTFLVGVILGCDNCDPIDPDKPQTLIVHVQP
jgi:hypothetical protein